MNAQVTFEVLRQRESRICELSRHYKASTELYLLPYLSPPITTLLGWPVSTEFEWGIEMSDELSSIFQHTRGVDIGEKSRQR